MDAKKLDAIYLSYINGQKTQMCTQIKAYGVKRFMIEFYEYVTNYFFYDNSLQRYADIVRNYFLLQ